uniref:Protein kinase domain-containing protein n=1 Tax=Ditylenchus dipsaci TaxID=166011 RepID=A0A915DLV4_9BILA
MLMVSDYLTFLNRRSTVTEQLARYLLRQIAEALVHLHTNGIMYRELRPENLTEFGFSTTQKESKQKLGRKDYMSPEMLNKKMYSYEVDWWAFGVLMYRMLVGKEPFQVENNTIINELDFPPNISKNARETSNTKTPKYVLDELNLQEKDQIKVSSRHASSSSQQNLTVDDFEDVPGTELLGKACAVKFGKYN